MTGVMAPAALGVKVTAIVQVPLGARVAPSVQVVRVAAMVNSVAFAGVRLGAAVISRAALPVFSTVKVWAALVVPTSWLAKVKLIGPGAIAQKSPSRTPLIPAEKYKVVGLLPVFPPPNSRAPGRRSPVAVIPSRISFREGFPSLD